MTIDRKMLALIGGAAIIALVGGGAGYVLRGDAAHSDEAAQGVETGGDAEAEAAPGEGTIMVTEEQLHTAGIVVAAVGEGFAGGEVTTAGVLVPPT